MARDFTCSIVIPIFNKWHLCHAILGDIMRHEEVDEIIVVNDCSDDSAVIDGLELWLESKLPLKVITNEINSGFTISSNNGLRYTDKPIATRHITFLISSDVRIYGKFIDQTAEILLGVKKSIVGNRLLQTDTGWNTFEGRVFPYLEGWFLACTSDGWKELGYFDQNYAPYDMEDVDLSTKAVQKGYALTPLNSPVIVHQGGGTIGFNPAREAITKRNKEYFRQKWMK